jgi:quercetin dioxygenase-like cupin family protein
MLRTSILRIVFTLVGFFLNGIAFGHVEPAIEVSETVVPQHEKAMARDLGMDGPTETKGVGVSKVLGMMPMDDEFPGMAGRMMRARELTLLPGGVVAVHQHNQRPGIAYLVEGTAVEHRSDRDAPIVHKAGDAAFEPSGTVHWWIKESDEPAKVVVVDIVPVE